MRCLSVATSCVGDQLVVDRRDGVLPQLRRRHPGAEVAGQRTHVAVQQLVPGLRERVRELGRVLVETLRDRLVDRVQPQGEVRGQHHRGVPLRRVVRVGHGARRLGVLGRPLLRPGRARGQLPVVPEQVVQVAVVPRHRLVGPGALEPAGERVHAYPALEAVLPAQALVLDRTPLGLRAEVLRVDGTVALADRVAADDERDRLLVVHRHPLEGLADVARGGERVRVAVGPLRVHVDQAHLHGAERTGESPFAAVALVAEPRVLGPPEDLLGLPDVLAAEAEPEGRQPHRLVGAVAREDQEVGPGDLPAVLLLDRPEQAARLVQAHVVRPAVERGEALGAAAATAAAVGDAVRARGVPAHPDEERSVVAVVGRPPVLRGRHHLDDVPLQSLDVEGRELLGVVEVVTHRVGLGGVLVQNREVELVGPPVPVRPRPVRRGRRSRNCRVLAFRHVDLSPVSLLPRGGEAPRTAQSRPRARSPTAAARPRSLARCLESIKSVRAGSIRRTGPDRGLSGRDDGDHALRPVQLFALRRLVTTFCRYIVSWRRSGCAS